MILEPDLHWQHDDTDTKAAAFNEGYDDYNGVTVQPNPYPPHTVAGRWWQSGYEMARQHDQSAYEEELG